MTDWKTVKLKGDVRDKAKDLEEHTYTEVMEAGINALTNGDTQTHTHSHTTDDVMPPDASAIAGAIAEELDADVDIEELSQAVAARIDYAELAKQTADEVEERLR